MDTQTMQLHDKVQRLIEQYTKDKKKLAEVEEMLAQKEIEVDDYSNQILQLQIDMEALQAKNGELTQVNADLMLKKQELEQVISTFEGFANDLNDRIDDLIPQIENL